MRKFLAAICIGFLTCTTAIGAEVPKSVQDFINKDFPNTNFRFDGAILLPDKTMYIPVNPAKLETPNEITIKSTYPQNMGMKQKPDMLILNNKRRLALYFTRNGNNANNRSNCVYKQHIISISIYIKYNACVSCYLITLFTHAYSQITCFLSS